MGSDTPTVKVEVTDDPLETMKKGGLKQGLKVLVNNQPYLSTNQVTNSNRPFFHFLLQFYMVLFKIE